jgi:hypothetical protein
MASMSLSTEYEVNVVDNAT